MITIETISYGSQAYQESLVLRNQVMRVPLGLDIFAEDLTKEQDCLIFGAFEEEKLSGVGVLRLGTTVAKIEYLCVAMDAQTGGIGKRLLQALEEQVRQEQIEWLELEARVSAQQFYEKQGYTAVGERYLLPIAPVGHIRMVKQLDA